MFRMFSKSDRRKDFNVLVLPDDFPYERYLPLGWREWMLCSARCLWVTVKWAGAGYGWYGHRTSHTQWGGWG